MTIKNWYTSANNQIEKFTTADGYVLNPTGVQKLVQAMAGFSVPSTTTLPTNYHTSLDPVIAANWLR